MWRNSISAWGWPSILLHWVGAAFILVLLVHGWWMTHLTPRPDRAANYAWHAALGYDLLVLLVLRLLWRWLNPVPALPTDLRPWERWAARLNHFGLYLLMFATTVVGWALAGTGRAHYDRDLLGAPVPLIYTSTDGGMHRLLEDSHRVLAYVLAALVLLHVIGALRHQFVKRNDLLMRMVRCRPAAAGVTTRPSSAPVASKVRAEGPVQ
jgi:cytochrome b561